MPQKILQFNLRNNMNTLKDLWKTFLENRLYIDVTIMIIGLVIVYFLLYLTAIQFVVYLLGCWHLGGYVGTLTFWLGSKFK